MLLLTAVTTLLALSQVAAKPAQCPVPTKLELHEVRAKLASATMDELIAANAGAPDALKEAIKAHVSTLNPTDIQNLRTAIHEINPNLVSGCLEISQPLPPPTPGVIHRRARLGYPPALERREEMGKSVERQDCAGVTVSLL